MTLAMRDEEIREQAIEQTTTKDIGLSIEMLKAFHIPDEKIIEQLKEKYQLTEEEARYFVLSK